VVTWYSIITKEKFIWYVRSTVFFFSKNIFADILTLSFSLKADTIYRQKHGVWLCQVFCLNLFEILLYFVKICSTVLTLFHTYRHTDWTNLVDALQHWESVQTHKIEIISKSLKDVAEVRYFEAILSDENYFHKCIESKLTLENICYH
jgi:hypothetical protein